MCNIAEYCANKPVKYPAILHIKLSNKIYIFHMKMCTIKFHINRQIK